MIKLFYDKLCCFEENIRLGFGILRRTNKRFANVVDSCINYACTKSDSSHIA